jgi:hypothetical protein
MLPSAFELFKSLGDQLGSVNNGEFQFISDSDCAYRVTFQETFLQIVKWTLHDTDTESFLRSGLANVESVADQPVSNVFPLICCDLYGRPFPSPGNPDAYLRRVYGDYQTVPLLPKLLMYACHPLSASRMLQVASPRGAFVPSDKTPMSLEAEAE